MGSSDLQKKIQQKHLGSSILEQARNTWEFYGLIGLKVFGSPGCGNVWPEGVVHSVMSPHLLCCVRQKCSEVSKGYRLLLWKQETLSRECQGGACGRQLSCKVSFLWVSSEKIIGDKRVLEKVMNMMKV